ncbi:MAG: AgmX/PglI C-terminal domain-containing protein [Bdellovibrionaceae bacterium]|nr:AgmX/PglI C-terminal domain-containing protein [Pseudobdellovibrionaceae bacterium]
MKRLRSLPFLFSVAGLLIFALALWRVSLEGPAPRSGSRTMARLEPVFGELWIERDGRKEPVNRSRPVERLTTVGTGAETEALLSFENGEQVRLLENSLVLIDWEAGRPVLVLRDGEIWPEKTKSNAESALVSREGVRRGLAEDLQERQQQPRRVVRPPPTEAAPVAKPVAAGNETLSSEYIQATLRTQRNQFFKCYTRLLQKTPGVSGEAALSFTIERTGRVSQAEVASASVQDPQFRRCLGEAVKRIEFKSFAGEPVSAVFPVRFE